MSESAPPPHASPHDALFKMAFERPEHAAGVLRTLLPEAVAQRINWSTLELVPGSVIDQELRGLETDLLFRASVGERSVLIYALLEHQSSVDPLMAFRLLRYMTRLWERWQTKRPSLRLLVIIPLVVAHGERPWTAPTSMLELFDADEDLLSALSPVLVSFQFLLEDLTTRPSATLRDREGFTALARFTLLLLQRGRVAEDLLEELRSWVGVFREVGAGPAGREDIVSVLAYAWIVGAVPPTALRALLRDDPQLDVDEIMGAAEKFIAQIGPPTWLQKGRAEGRAERGIELLLRQLSRRFGAVPGDAVALVRAASVEELDAMADRVLDAGTLDEVLGR